MEIFTEDVPVETYPIPVPREKKIAYLWRMGMDAGVVKEEGGAIKWV